MKRGGRAPVRPPRSNASRSARKSATAPRKLSAWDPVFRLVKRIPRGRVMTYGQISVLIERRLSAVAVGWALHGCPDDVPWHRVVNARGGCSTDGIGHLPPGFQRKLLEKEGVRFDRDGCLDLEQYAYRPRRS